MKRLPNWRGSVYPSNPKQRLLPHAYFLHDTGYEELIPGPVIFLEEPIFDDDGNCTVDRMLLPALIQATAREAMHTNTAAPAPAPKATPASKRKRDFAPRKKKR